MANIFAGSEVIQIGVQIEKNGKAFYLNLAKQTSDKRVTEAFNYLAAQEEQHIVAFRRLLELVETYEPKEAYPGEYFAYLNALAGDNVFNKENAGEEISKMIKTDNEAIDMAIGFEKDSILFFEAMKNVVHEAEATIVDNLINQEKDHLQKLVELKAVL